MDKKIHNKGVAARKRRNENRKHLETNNKKNNS